MYQIFFLVLSIKYFFCSNVLIFFRSNIPGHHRTVQAVPDTHLLHLLTRHHRLNTVQLLHLILLLLRLKRRRELVDRLTRPPVLLTLLPLQKRIRIKERIEIRIKERIEIRIKERIKYNQGKNTLFFSESKEPHKDWNVTSSKKLRT